MHDWVTGSNTGGSTSVDAIQLAGVLVAISSRVWGL
jgi:hypothetical protein